MPSPDTRPLPYTLETTAGTEGGAIIRIGGRLTAVEAGALWRDARDLKLQGPLRQVDVTGLERLDAAGAVILTRIRRLGGGDAVPLAGGKPEILRFLDRLNLDAVGAPPPPAAPTPFLDDLGERTEAALGTGRTLVAFVGSLTEALGSAIRRPRKIRWRDTLDVMEQAGVDAVPIVLLINYLVGLVMGFQAAIQLRQFGADIYVANLVGLATVRELGPLMTAIIVAGRSGSGFAAEIGTMKVNEEVDALQTMGLDPRRFLLVPKVVALLLVVPCLTLLGEAFAILGGATVGIYGLDIPGAAYWQQTLRAIGAGDLLSGLSKSLLFAVIVAAVGCFEGFRTSGGAQGVGRSATRAVVLAIFFLIVADAIFTVAFHVLGV